MKQRLAELRRDGRWIPWAFVGMFVVVIGVNGVMVALAMASWPGLTSRNHYLEGLAYNDRLAAAEAQRALGWRMALAAEPLGDGRVRVDAELGDRDGAPVSGAELRVRFWRPTHAGHDFAETLTYQGSGRYAAVVRLPLPGQWDLRATAVRGEQVFQKTERLVIRP